MQDRKDKGNKLVFALQRFSKAWKWLVGKRQIVNKGMYAKYNPHRIAIATSVAVGLLWIVMLFVPPYLGVADDGTLYKVMDRAGISYIEESPEDIYNNYYIRRYYLRGDEAGAFAPSNSQDIIVQVAVTLDQLLTRDQIFDLRFLALLYGVLYLPAVYLLTKNAVNKVKNFSEAIAIGILSVIIFGDVSYIAYFSSFYPEALWFICLIGSVAFLCNIQRKKESYWSIVALLIYGSIFTTSRQQCGVIGFAIAGFFIRALFFNQRLRMKVCYVFCAFFMSMMGMLSSFTLESDFTLTSKYHAMTRGVLFQAPNPEKALAEFGIHNSYSVMANTSAYDFYPFILSDDEKLSQGFFDEYDTSEIIFYYIKHPVSFLRMLDVAVKSTNSLHRSYCGNYEKSYGMPPMAKSVFWSGWNYIKVHFAPQTVGYLFILLVLTYLVNRKKVKNASEIENSSIKLMDLTYILMAIGLSQGAITIVMSGDAEFTQHAFLLGASTDLIVYFLVVEALSKFKIFEDGGNNET